MKQRVQVPRNLQAIQTEAAELKKWLEKMSEDGELPVQLPRVQNEVITLLENEKVNTTFSEESIV